MTSVADFSLRQNYGIVFDQLSAPTAAYIQGEELEGWFADAGLSDVRISQRHGNSWRGRSDVIGDADTAPSLGLHPPCGCSDALPGRCNRRAGPSSRDP